MRRTVTRIVDGDTFEVGVAVQGAYSIRLARVNAPELNTAAGRKAKNVLKGLIGGRTVTLHPVSRSYGRIVAEVICDWRNISQVMKQKGHG